MPPTLRDFNLFTNTNHVAEYMRENFPQVRSAALSAEKLVGDPNWERYLMKCQALLEEAEQARTGWMDKCTRAVSENDRIVAQWNFHACDARVTTLKEVMALPKELIHAYRSELGGDGRPVDGVGNSV